MIALFHEQFRQAIHRRYFDGLTPTAALPARHQELADLFRADAIAAEDPPRWRADRPRALAELPYHLGEAGRRDELGRLLGDAAFLEAKCVAGLVFDLLRDCDRALAPGPLAEVAAVREAFLQPLPRGCRPARPSGAGG